MVKKQGLKLAVGLIKAGTGMIMEAGKERSRQKQMQLQREFELAQEEKRTLVRMREAQENRKHQEELTMIQAKNARDIALYNARIQKELSGNNAERKFVLDNFPLYVRKWSSRESLERAQFLPVKIVMVPPGSGDGNKYSSGYENLLEAALTRFLQENLPGEYYEFLGGAWRSSQFRAQAAYKLIYEEFSDEPFLIVEYSFTRDTYISLRICFWYPDSAAYKTVQLIENWDIREFLSVCAQERISRNGADDGQCRTVQDDYDECFRLLADIGAVITGTFVDCYQILEGIYGQPLVLKALPQIVSLFLKTEEREIQKTVLEWVVSEYECLSQSPLLSIQAEQSCMTTLAETLLALQEMQPEIKMRSKAISYMKQAWDLWCISMGVRAEELKDMMDDPQSAEKLLEIIRNDEASFKNLERIRALYQNTMLLKRNPVLASLTAKAGELDSTLPKIQEK